MPPGEKTEVSREVGGEKGRLLGAHSTAYGVGVSDKQVVSKLRDEE